jgi:hypothetical protein
MGELNVAMSLLTVLPVMFRPPGTALPIQLAGRFQADVVGALDHVWLAAKTVTGLRTANKMAHTVRDVFVSRVNACVGVKCVFMGFQSCGIRRSTAIRWLNVKRRIIGSRDHPARESAICKSPEWVNRGRVEGLNR